LTSADVSTKLSH